MPTAVRSKNKTGSVIEQPSFTVGTLAARTSLFVDGPAVTRGGKILSSTIHGSLHGGTAGDPPLLLGLVRGDMVQAEVEAYLELDGPGSPELVSEGEIATRGRLIRRLAVLSPDPGSSRNTISEDNKSMKGLAFSETGEGNKGGWQWFVYNISAAKAFTTGSFCELQVSNFVEWNPSG